MRVLSTMVTIALLIASAAFIALPAGAATKSPFCFAGSPTPKYVCDAIKANTKPKPARTRHDTAKNAIANVR
mgnify:CR=1 FL=1